MSDSLADTMPSSLNRLILLLLAAACGKHTERATPPVPVPWERALAAAPIPGALYTTVEIRGEFSERGRQDINRMSVNTRDVPKEPPPLPVSPAQLAVLNRELPAAVDEIVKEVGLTRATSAQGGDVLRLVREPDGDVFFALVVEASPGNDLGGHYGGLDLVTKLRSRHRKEDIHNWGFATVAFGTTETAPRDLRTALRAALTSSLRDLRNVLHKPIGDAELAFDVSGMSNAQRASIANSIAPCAARMGAPVDHKPGSSTETRIVHSIAFRFGRWEPAQTEDQWLDWYSRLLPSISSMGKGGGCVERTPFAGMTADVRREGRTLAISFRAKP